MTTKHPFSTRKGRRLRLLKLQSDPLCERCRRERKVTAAVTVHHIVRIADGGSAWAWDNLESVCDEHHKQAHGRRPKGGVDSATGLPTGDHWWNT